MVRAPALAPELGEPRCPVRGPRRGGCDDGGGEREQHGVVVDAPPGEVAPRLVPVGDDGDAAPAELVVGRVELGPGDADRVVRPRVGVEADGVDGRRSGGGPRTRPGCTAAPAARPLRPRSRPAGSRRRAPRRPRSPSFGRAAASGRRTGRRARCATRRCRRTTAPTAPRCPRASRSSRCGGSAGASRRLGAAIRHAPRADPPAPPAGRTRRTSSGGRRSGAPAARGRSWRPRTPRRSGPAPPPARSRA